MTNGARGQPARIPLTSLSHGGGCACKLGATELAQVLRHVPGAPDPNVLVDAGTRDDAAVYRIGPDRALVVTVDFFTPIVNDAAAWGAIAAANAVSDVYAMGGTPLFALNLVAWPRDKVPFDVLGEVLDGAAKILARARCLVLGGHSIDDAEPKFGLVVVGDVHPDHMLTNAGGRAGDLLVLTKPLGTGIMATALKQGRMTDAEMGPAIYLMTELNDGAARAALAHGVTAATDVTGFGLIGHLVNIVAGSGVGARLDMSRVPTIAGAVELAAQGAVPGGTRRNLEAVRVEWSDDVSQMERLICADAQTSGGLLLAVPPDRVRGLVGALQAEHTLASRVIGELTSEAGVIRVGKGAFVG